MKQLFILLFLFTCGSYTAAQGIEKWVRRWASGDIFLVTTGYQVPLYGRQGKSLTDPLMGYARQDFVFMPTISSEVKKGFGIDARFTYLRSKRWMREIARNLSYENPAAFSTVYNNDPVMQIWSFMLGPSYRIKKGRNVLIVNLLGGFGNQPIKSVWADIKSRGSNDLVTWQILEIADPNASALQLYTNIYAASVGLKMAHRFPTHWGITASCDLFYSQRKGQLEVTRTNQKNGDTSGYSVAPPRSTGWMITPGIGIFLIVD